MSVERPFYAGPVIDAHHHLWDLSGGHDPWLTRPEAAIPALGDTGFLRRDYLPQDCAADIAGRGVVASVHVEAVWDPARSPVEETAWLDALPRPPGIAALLDAHAASPRVAAARETIRWRPDPAKRWTRQGLVHEPAWRRGLAELARHGWALDLLMNPHQAEEVAALARDVPGQQWVVNHCGTPNDRDAEGLARWRAGLRAMGRQPNVAVKLSNYAAYATARTFGRPTAWR